MNNTLKKGNSQAMVKYSICITNYNARHTLRQCLESVLSQIDSDFEVVVSDNFSTDGSREILEECARNGKIKLVIEHSNRGRGRQIAFENSNGDYIISGIDTDDVIKPVLKDVLRLYHEKHEGYMLSFGTIHIIPRHLVIALGGWRDLQWGEDVDFAKRIEAMGKSHYFPDVGRVVGKKGHLKRGFLQRVRGRYLYYQSRYKIGFSVLDDLKAANWYKRPIEILIAIFALAVIKLKHVDRFGYESDQRARE
jgi:glycosyltransferase involved in cell wall biosynthesis